MKKGKKKTKMQCKVINITSKCGKKGCEIAPCILPIGSTQEEYDRQIAEQLAA